MARSSRSRSTTPPDSTASVSWVDAEGQLVLPAGFTDRGPRLAARDAGPGWRRAQNALQRVCSLAYQHEVKVGFVERAGTGRSRDAFRAVVDAGGKQIDVYALVPNDLAAPDCEAHALTEFRLLVELGRRDLSLRVPASSAL